MKKMKAQFALAGVCLLALSAWALDSVTTDTTLSSPLQTAVATFDAETNPIHREEAIVQFAEQVESGAITSTLDELAAMPSSSTVLELGALLVQRWTTENPTAATTWTTKLPVGEFQLQCVTAAAAAWGDSIAENALSAGWNSELLAPAEIWARSLTQPAARSQALAALSQEIARVEPREALRLAEAIPVTNERNHSLTFATAQWAGRDSEAAIGWAQQLQTVELRDAIFAAITAAHAENFPVNAGTFAVNIVTEAPRDRAIVSVVQRWVQQTPLDAAQWVEQFQPGTLQNASVQNLVSIWKETNLASLVDWLNTLPTGHFRDIAIKAFGPLNTTQ